MKLLYTHAGQAEVLACANALGARHAVECLELSDRVETDWADVLWGVDAVVHGASFALAEETGPGIATAACQAYELAQAMNATGIHRVVVLSRLEVFEVYEPTFLIDETWRPRPRPFCGELGPFVVESVFREFARERRVHGFALRLALGELQSGGIDLPDLVERALSHSFEPHRYAWHIINVSRSDRFVTRELKQILGVDLG